MTRRSFPFLLGTAALVVLTTQLAACDRQPVRAEAPLRMVKLITPSTTAAGDYRFVAQVRQAQRADLSFENGGRVAGVMVDVGDTVRRGQVLATLDPEPAHLQILQAEAQVRSTAGQLQERRDQLRQQQAMHADGATSKLTLDAAQLAVTMADAAHSSATAALELAARAQRVSVLRAPYAGRIKARLAQPGALAAAGQVVLQIEGDSHPQVVADLPAALLPASLKPGAVVTARSAEPADANDATNTINPTNIIRLTLRGLADHIDAGGTVQAIFDLQPEPGPGHASLRSGAALSIAIDSGAKQVATLPLTAVAQGAKSGTGHVFVFHHTGNVLERRSVVLGCQRGDSIEVTEGLQPGEQVAGAGTAFLIDHQRVVPYQSASTLAAGEQP
ncbi:efflux RND transporter periplasmic adaptor subunit [Duganella phyllosphaerae]|uniref:Macrolide export protein MacA n=1 Tax=Duganella phyllosphaerae TaxID=762836 RepID=A0A1E7WZQ7_9BURK|nr:efflux RND transporter periplasmic adaptor subunit [Duganella phyllosphaerae]OFA05394.1 macrolide export protein MacA [Duganella phyllosphaerae]